MFIDVFIYLKLKISEYIATSFYLLKQFSYVYIMRQLKVANPNLFPLHQAI